MATGARGIEQDYSHYVAQAKKTVFAVVGTATKGPVGEAVVCTSTQDLVNKFGPLNPKCLALYAGQYFLSQSSKLYFVRAASASAASATTKVAGTGTSGSVEDALTISVLEPGTYYNGYTMKIEKGTEEDAYTLTLKSAKGVIVDSAKEVKLDDLKVGYKKQYFEVTAVNTNAASLTAGDYTLSGGIDGIEEIEAGDYITAANALSLETIDMNLFAVPGVSDPEVVVAMLGIAETRGDCLYLVDPPKGLTRDGVIQWHNGEGDYETKFNSSYGALYYDWQIIYDPINKVRVEVPPSVSVAASYAYSDRVSEVWYAPAGLNRGVVRGVLDTVTKLSKTDVDVLYGVNGGTNNINSIYDDPQVGLVLWGQKTLHRGDTALDRVNVRRLLNYLKRVIVAACNYLTFDPNDRITWNSFSMKVKPVLENVRKKRGIYEYRIVKGSTIVTDEDIDNYKMPAMILIRPTKAAEEIPIYFTITSTGADFNEVLEANGILSE